MEARAVAISYIKALSREDREAVKSMLSHGVTCGADYARMNGLDPSVLSNELNLIFGGR